MRSIAIQPIVPAPALLDGSGSWVVLLVLLLLVVAVAWMLFGRHHATVGGISRRSMRGREGRSGAMGSSTGTDHESFDRQAGGHGMK